MRADYRRVEQSGGERRIRLTNGTEMSANDFVKRFGISQDVLSFIEDQFPGITSGKVTTSTIQKLLDEKSLALRLEEKFNIDPVYTLSSAFGAPGRETSLDPVGYVTRVIANLVIKD